MNLLGLENTPTASMGHDQVLGTTNDSPRPFMMKNVDMGLEQRVVRVPTQASHDRDADTKEEKRASSPVQAGLFWKWWRWRWRRSSRGSRSSRGIVPGGDRGELFGERDWSLECSGGGSGEGAKLALGAHDSHHC